MALAVPKNSTESSGLQPREMVFGRILIRPNRLTSTRTCHSERSAAESKDLRLPFAESVQLLQGRINRLSPRAAKRLSHRKLRTVQSNGCERPRLNRQRRRSNESSVVREPDLVAPFVSQNASACTGCGKMPRFERARQNLALKTHTLLIDQ